MRILILTQYFPPEIGAAPTRLYNVARQLARLGNEVEIVTGLPNYPKGRFFDGYQNCFYRKEIREGMTLHRLWMVPALGGGIRRILNYVTFAASSFVGMFRAVKPDYIFVESPPLLLAIPGYVFSRIWRVPLILNIADLWPDTPIDMGFMRKDGLAARLTFALERWSYRKASYVNAVTEGIGTSLLRDKSVPQQKVLFLPNGVDTVLFQPRPTDLFLKQQLGLEGKRIILWAGTLGKAHGLEYVLQAAGCLQHHPEIHFLFVGEGSAKESLELLCQQLKLTNVSFHASVPFDELPSYFSIAESGLASLLPLPVHEGARPSKVFPVLASGKPLIYVGKGEGARLIREANAGIVVPPENPEALAKAVENLVMNPEFAKELGGNGRRFVETHFQWSQLMERWVVGLQHMNPTNAHSPTVS
jgi:colanic acid biosynthesis glycosyl transferase WcaI